MSCSGGRPISDVSPAAHSWIQEDKRCDWTRTGFTAATAIQLIDHKRLMIDGERRIYLRIVLIRADHETFNRLAFNESIETRSLPTLTHVLQPIGNSFASQLARHYPSRLCLLCRFSEKLHSTSRFCPSISLASPRLRSLTVPFAASASPARTLDHSHCPCL
jgi:hypothetical protein